MKQQLLADFLFRSQADPLPPHGIPHENPISIVSCCREGSLREMNHTELFRIRHSSRASDRTRTALGVEVRCGIVSLRIGFKALSEVGFFSHPF